MFNRNRGKIHHSLFGSHYKSTEYLLVFAKCLTQSLTKQLGTGSFERVINAKDRTQTKLLPPQPIPYW